MRNNGHIYAMLSQHLFKTTRWCVIDHSLKLSTLARGQVASLKTRIFHSKIAKLLFLWNKIGRHYFYFLKEIKMLSVLRRSKSVLSTSIHQNVYSNLGKYVSFFLLFWLFFYWFSKFQNVKAAMFYSYSNTHREC